MIVNNMRSILTALIISVLLLTQVGCSQLMSLPMMILAIPFQVIKMAVSLIPIAIKYAPYALLFVSVDNDDNSNIEYAMNDFYLGDNDIVSLANLPNGIKCYTVTLQDKSKVLPTFMDNLNAVLLNPNINILFSSKKAMDFSKADLYRLSKYLRENNIKVGVEDSFVSDINSDSANLSNTEYV